MNYAVEMSSDAMIYVPSFITIGSDIQKLFDENTDTDTQTQREQGNLIKLT
jgi:hypothetical protein